MALGIKIKNFTTEGTYTIEELYDAIKSHKFTAGEPSLTKHGPSTIITFPALDSQNQVWIIRSGFSAKTQKFSIQKNEAAGIGNMASNMVLDKVTGGFFGLGRLGGKNSKECERLVEETAKEIATLHL